MPKVSVIILIYNVEKYLEQCLKSIVNQSYKNLEILCMIDGSTDGSMEICQKYHEKDKRVKIIFQKNSGLGAARNKGIIHASGEFITFIDGDDFVTKDYIKHLVDMHNEYNCDIAVSSFTKYINGEIWIPYETLDKGESYDGVYNSIDWLKKCYIDMGTIFVVAWGKLYKKSLFKYINYPFHIKTAEDEFTTWKLYLESNKIAFKNQGDYLYRIHKGSVMSQSEEFNVMLRQAEALKERINVMTIAGIDVGYLINRYVNLLESLLPLSLENSNYDLYKKIKFQLEMIARYK